MTPTLLALLLQTAVAAPVPAAEAVVRGIYAPYLRHRVDSPTPHPDLETHPALSQSLRALLQAASTVVPVDAQPETMGCDPFVDAQDWNLPSVALTSNATPGGATVTATFLAGTAPTTVTYRLIREGRSWRVDDITGTAQGSVRALLMEALARSAAEALPSDRPPTPVPAAEAVAQAFYEPYLSAAGGLPAGDPADDRRLSWSLRARLREQGLTALYPTLPAALTLHSATNPAGATVWATLDAGEVETTATLHLIREDGSWHIDAIDPRSAEASLPQTLAALTTFDLPEQTAMAAVEAAIVEALAPYQSPASSPPPLHSSPALTRDLRAQLRSAVAALLQTGELPAALAVDPLAEALRGAASPELRVHLTADGATVDLGATPSSPPLTLRLRLEDGAWRIDDILHADGTSLRGQLAARP